MWEHALINRHNRPVVTMRYTRDDIRRIWRATVPPFTGLSIGVEEDAALIVSSMLLRSFKPDEIRIHYDEHRKQFSAAYVATLGKDRARFDGSIWVYVEWARLDFLDVFEPLFHIEPASSDVIAIKGDVFQIVSGENYVGALVTADRIEAWGVVGSMFQAIGRDHKVSEIPIRAEWRNLKYIGRSQPVNVEQ